MNNPLKLVLGSLIGAGIGVALSKVAETRQEPGLSAAQSFTFADSESAPSTSEAFGDRLARAKAAGADARVQKEAELRDQFREKVRRSNALTAPPIEQ